MNTIRECFDTILKGGKEESRQAARRVRKLVYSSSALGREKYDEIATLVKTAPESYMRISEDWRQENFVMAVSVIYFLHDRESQPDFLFLWLFQLLQHQNGNIRHAAVRMIEHELGPLTYHIRFPGKEFPLSKLSPERADGILIGLQTNLNKIVADSWKPAYEKYKYIDDLPSGTYKSVQHILACLEDYSRDIHGPADISSHNEILK